jgi:hypothetical protein
MGATYQRQPPSVWEEILNIADDVENAKDRPTLRDAVERLRAIGACDACAGTGVLAGIYCVRCARKGTQTPWDHARNRAYFGRDDGKPNTSPTTGLWDDEKETSSKVEAPF